MPKGQAEIKVAGPYTISCFCAWAAVCTAGTLAALIKKIGWPRLDLALRVKPFGS